jgi:hypothetical protein
MLKMIFTMTRMTAVVGLMAALPSIAALQRNTMTRAAAAAAHAESGDPLLDQSAATLGLADGQARDPQEPNLLTSIPGVLGLLSGTSAGASQPKPTPEQPTTVIYRTAPKGNRGKGGTAVMDLPPGASATFVDGRLQVYYPPDKLSRP